MHLMIAALLLASAVLAQVEPANPDFEVGELGHISTGWLVPSMISQAGFGVGLVHQGCHGVRLLSAVRVEGRQPRAQICLCLDRADSSMAFLENICLNGCGRGAFHVGLEGPPRPALQT